MRACRRILAVAALSVLTTHAQTLPPPPVSPVPVTRFEYDAQGNPTRLVQAPGAAGFAFATTRSYDNLHRLQSSTDARSGRTDFAYNGREAVTQVTDPRRLATQYARNGLGDVTLLTSPDAGNTKNTYDAAGNLRTRVDANGVSATYSYDAFDRLTSAAYTKKQAAGRTLTWTYDQVGPGYSYGIGRLTSTGFPEGSTQYAHDAQGRVVTAVQRVNAAAGANAVPLSHTTRYAYLPGGRLQSITYPSGRVLTITYAGSQPTALSLAKDGASPAQPLISAIEHEPFGPVRRWQWHLAAGTQPHERVFDLSGRIVRYPLGPHIRDLTYDAGDRITAYTHHDGASGAAAPALDQRFGYDETGRMTTVVGTAYASTIAYDANGNRTNVTLGGTPRAYATASGSNRLASISNPVRSFTYDASGNTTVDSDAMGGYTATWLLEGRLGSLKRGIVTTTYAYDAHGQRVRKFSSTGAASTVVFVHDLQGHLLGEYDATGAPLREYVWLGDVPVAVFVPSGAAGNPPLVYFIHADHLDTPRVIVDRDNRMRWRWFSEPFGVTMPETNPAGLGEFTFNLRFPGHYYDQQSGLRYNWHRYYDASTGRYTQSDPIGILGGLNTYAYVFGDPVNYTDPNGLNPFAGAWAGAGIGSALGPLGTVVGGLIGTGIGAWLGWNVIGPMLAKPPENAYDPNGPKAPGKPTEADGFRDPKEGENWVPNPNPGKGGSKWGWEDANGNVWCPSGQGGRAHGGPHWDVQTPGGGYRNVRPRW